MTPAIRLLTTLDDFEAVLTLEREVWGCGDEDTVPVCLMVANAKIGGLMLGAFDESGCLVGFVYAVPGCREGKPIQWSHMTGVKAAWRGRGVGMALKREQRRVTLARGIDRIDWTFDPLQAENANLNIARLGARSREYQRNVYGRSGSILHAGTETDRLIARWNLSAPHVAQRLDAATPTPLADIPGDVPRVNRVARGTRWLIPEGWEPPPPGTPRVALVIPTGFTELQQRDRELARAWRFETRDAFEHLLSGGYEVTGFVLDRASGRGTYLLTRES